jgi:hypothetical protein
MKDTGLKACILHRKISIGGMCYEEVFNNTTNQKH